MLVCGSEDAEGNTLPPPEAEDDRACTHAEYDPFGFFSEPAGGEDEVVDQVGQHQDGEVQRGQLCTRVSKQL